MSTAVPSSLVKLRAAPNLKFPATTVFPDPQLPIKLILSKDAYELLIAAKRSQCHRNVYRMISPSCCIKRVVANIKSVG